jgi:hypothetical protein
VYRAGLWLFQKKFAMDLGHILKIIIPKRQETVANHSKYSEEFGLLGKSKMSDYKHFIHHPFN